MTKSGVLSQIENLDVRHLETCHGGLVLKLVSRLDEHPRASDHTFHHSHLGGA